jgi:hypothetical protein
MGHENQETHDQRDHQEAGSHQASIFKPSPVITWEQSKSIECKPDSSGRNVIDIETYRRLDSTTIDTEATVSVRELPSLLKEEPVRVIIISSGFGQKHAVQTNTIQGKAA